MSSGRRVLWRGVQIVLLVAIGYGIYRRLGPQLRTLDWEDVTRWRPDLVPLLISFVLLIAVYVAHGLLWRRIMADLRIGNPPARDTLHVYFLAGLGRYIPGKIWQIAGLALLARRIGLPGGAATAAAVLGQFGFLTTGLLFVGVTLPEWRPVVSSGEPLDVAPIAVGTALLISAGIVLWMLIATPLGHGVRAFFIRRLGTRAGERLRAAFELADRVSAGAAIGWAAGYALSWIVLGAAFALFTTAIVPNMVGSTRVLAGAVAAAYLLGYFAFVVPAGIGIREGVMFVLLESVIGDPGAALVVTGLSRVWFTAAELVPLAFLPAPRPGRTALSEEKQA
jgi:hypothetical protein